MNEIAVAGPASRAAPNAADAMAFVQQLAAGSSRLLGETVSSVILHGSLALRDYAPRRSDVDVLLIVARSLGRAQMNALVRAVVAEQTRAPGRVDLRVVTREIAATPPQIPPMELYVGLSPGGQPEVVSREPEPDLLVELSLCRQCGRALLGTGPRELIGEIPDRWVLHVGDVQLARWQALTDDARNAELMVLTACRIWRFSGTRIHCSKSEAGRWALSRDPSLQAVRAALRQRAGDPARIEPDDIARLLTIARAKIAAAQI